MKIGNTIKKIRKKKGWSQKELADRCSLSQTYLSQIESGTRQATIETLENISNTLDVPLPIISFLSLDVDSINPEKKVAYLQIEPAIKGLLEGFFITNP